ncbi:MAG: hypothetical protein ABGZ35_26640 [Planctomycetaceae bacterium]|jgi:hypothetical protein
MYELASACRYLSPAAPSFWRWADGGDAAEWNFGGTIAFREQIGGVLAVFEGSRLPPFELILLALAACRDTWPEDRKRLEAESELEGRMLRGATLDSLEYIQRLPRQLRTSADVVLTIVQTIFERHPFDAPDPALVVKTLNQPRWLTDMTRPESQTVSVVERTGYLNWFRQRTVRLTVEQLLNRMSTGLDQLPVAAEDDSPEEASTDHSVCRLLDELADDEEHRGLVRLVRMVSAVLTLPRSPSEPSELPQGGVSDIANRGNPDQLLLSELAYDDETLMTRIALNEALYIRRETPPADPVQERSLLLDGGIRMWGLPRLLATAVGLALAKEERGQSVHVFRSDRGGLVPVDFTTRSGLTEHLAALDHRPHPGRVLKSWQNQVSGDEVHRVLITEDSVLADEEFRRQFLEQEMALCFFISVNRTGRVQLIRRTQVGEHLLREIWLDPDELSGAASTQSDSLIDASIDPELPAILRLRHLPLRLPYHASDVKTLVRFPRSGDEKPDVLQVTRDRRLLLWDTLHAGGRQLTDRLPQGSIRWSGKLADDGSVSMVIGNQQSVELCHVRVTRDRQTVEVFALHPHHPKSRSNHIFQVAGHLGVLFVVFRTSIAALDPITGEQLDSIVIPLSYQSEGGRYFRDLCRWYMISFSSGRLTFEFLADLPEPSTAVKTLGIVGSEDRPIALRSNGEAYDILRKETRQIVQASQWAGGALLNVSSDGLRFVIVRPLDEAGEQNVRPTLYPIPSAYVVQISHISSDETPQFTVDELNRCRDPYGVLFGGDDELTAMPGNKAQFKKPARMSYGRSLMIVTQKGRRLLLDMRQGHPRAMILREATAEDRPFRDTEDFCDVPAPRGVGYRLKEVKWADGSWAILDSRGMLHLQSSDADIPETTLILNESNVSGWCSDGGAFGLPYYIEANLSRHRPLDPQRAMEHVRQFVQRLP